MLNGFQKKFTGKARRRGYTLIELLAVIGILAVVAAIAIPSAVYIRDTLSFKQKNDYAETIFLAAQANLTEMRADGRITRLQKAELRVEGSGCDFVPTPEANDNNASDFPSEDWSAEYMYCVSGSEAFDLVLPEGSVESVLRDRNILIEYNPYTGNVYSVFYSEGDSSLTYDNVARDEAARKRLKLGYYCGSGLSSSIMEIVDSKVNVRFVNGEEGVVELRVPLPEQFYESPMDFINNLTITAYVIPDSLQMAVYHADGTVTRQTDPDIPSTGTVLEFTFNNNVSGAYPDALGFDSLEEGRTVVARFSLDRLLAGESFGSKVSGGKKLSEIANESDFTVLPGQNVTIIAHADYEDPDGMFEADISDGHLSGVNPMFEYLIESSTNPGRYVLAVSNGRNLQNLNALAPSVAEKVEAVVFTDDIRWDETVYYYQDRLGTGTSDLPVCDLPYFVPIHNEALFGTAEFVYPTIHIGNWLDWLNEFIDQLLGTSDGDVPTLTDELDARIDPETGKTIAESHAQILGMDGGKKICNLNINTAKYQSVSRVEYYAGDVDFTFTGLFAYVNTSIYDLQLVNPVVKGYPFADSGNRYSNPATGALVGCAGYNTLITGCGVYVDRSDPAFDSSKMRQTDYSGTGDQTWYGVSGEGAVGGLVGYAKSHRTTSGDLTGDTEHLAFSNCFAAVNVSGNMRGASSSNKTVKHFGYSNGVGGFIGNSELTNFYNCYASGNVRANGCYVEKNTLDSLLDWIPNLFGITTDLKFNGRTGMGAGGFVGTSHGTRYTNCFATGNVDATNSYSPKGTEPVLEYVEVYPDIWLPILVQKEYNYRTLGSGGFAGFMSYDETKLYGNDDPNNTSIEIAQHSVFTNCYSVGRATVGTGWNVNRTALENFSGANGRVRLRFSESTNFMGNYYELYAPLVSEQHRTPNYEDYYIFRHSYYLSNYYLDISDDGRENSNMCAAGEAYETLVDLTGKHRDRDGWVTKQIDAIKQIPVQRGGTYEQYFDAAMTETYKNLYAEGFPSDTWCKATADDTHAYSVENAGQAYPFTMIKGLPYYGDWPEVPVSAGLSYYETYEDGTTVYFPLNSDEVSVPDDAIVKEDGYVIFIANENAAQESTNTSITVQMGGYTWNLTRDETVDAPDGSSAHSFNVFYLPEGYLDIQPSEGEFYVEVTAICGDTSYILYFNPNAAMTQVNPPDYNKVDNLDGSSTVAADKPGNPTRILIRSARQFAAIKNLDSFWGEDITYIQQRNIDAQYLAEADRAVTIGTDESPFAATYTGSGGHVGKAKLTGFAPESNGLFGTLTGTVMDLDIHCESDAAVSTGGANTGFLAGTNSGAISNVAVSLQTVSITATENAGLLVGSNSGTIDGCDVAAADVTLAAGNVGGLVGSSQGGSIKNSSDAMTSLIANNAAYAGGFVGLAQETEFENVTARITDSFASGSAMAGGFAGSIQGGTVLICEVEIGSASAAAAFGGLAGSAKDVTFENAKVSIDSVQAGTAAGGIGTGESVNVNNATVNLGTGTGTVSAAGFANELNIGLSGTVRDVSVKLTGSITCGSGSAAGFAEELGGRVMQSKVYLGQSDPVSISGSVAAGFAVTSTATIDACVVSGSGTITGTDSAAGFLITAQSDTIASSIVTPVYGNKTDAYAGSSNDRLTISSSVAAAGFIVTSKATVMNCTALGTVNGATAAGFIVTNEGPVSLSMVNTALSGNGSAFAVTNHSSIQNSYAWYAGGNADALEEGEPGTYYGCFFAPLDSEKSASELPVTVFPGNGAADANGKTAEAVTLDGISLDTLNGASGSVWKYGSSFAAYAYTLGSEPYSYPMIRVHYGDWILPPRYAYGLAYYEEVRLEDGRTVTNLRLVDISNLEGKPNIYDEPLEVDTISAGDDQQIVSAGYAIFCRSTAQLNIGSATLGDPLKEDTLNLEGLNLNPDEFKETYNLYALNITSFREEEIRAADGLSGVSYIPCFANAIDSPAAPYEIRTPEQFAAISGWSGDSSFIQTHDLDLTNCRYIPASVVGYEGSNCAIQANGRLFSQVSGQVSNLTVMANSLNSSLFGTNDGTLENIHAQIISAESGGSGGVLAEKNSGSIRNCSVNQDMAAVPVSLNTGTIPDVVFGGLVGENSGTITGSSANVDITWSGSAGSVTIGGLVGLMDDGKLEGCNVSGSITNSGTAATAIVGGAVGRDGVNSAEYTEVASTVSVASGWSGSKLSASDITTTDQGPVGMFVGYVHNGEFSDCSANDGTNKVYQFLGEVYLTEKSFDTDIGTVWSSENNNAPDAVYRDSNGAYSPVSGYETATTYPYIPADLTDCTFAQNGTTYTQTYGADRYYYTLNETPMDKFTTEQVTVKFEDSVQVKYSDLLNTDSSERAPKDYYYRKADGTYVRVYVSRSSGFSGWNYIYTYILYDSTGNELRKEEINRWNLSSAQISLYHLPTLSLSSSDSYLLVTSNGEYALKLDDGGTLTPIPFSLTLPELEGLAQAKWNFDGTNLKQGETSKSVTVVYEDQYPSANSPVSIQLGDLAYNVESNFLLYKLNQTDSHYYKGTFSPLTGTQYERQSCVAKDADGNVLTVTAAAARAAAPASTDALVPGKQTLPIPEEAGEPDGTPGD